MIYDAERSTLEVMARIQREYIQVMKPYVDRLAQIRAMTPISPMLMGLNNTPFPKENTMHVRIKRVRSVQTKLPTYRTAAAAGADVAAFIPEGDICINSMQIVKIPTNLALEIPEGYEVQVRSRSGLASKHGITVVNSPGTIDSDYRGEVIVALINLGEESYNVVHGDFIAQLVCAPVKHMDLVLTEELSNTERGAGGFGHTGRQ